MNDQERPGPDPERLKLPFADWVDAVREALKKKRPPEGWPDEDAGESESERERDE